MKPKILIMVILTMILIGAGSNFATAVSGKTAVTAETLLAHNYGQHLYGRTLSWISGTNYVVASVWESSSNDTWIEKIDVTTGRRYLLVRSDTASISPNGLRIAYVKDGMLWVAGIDGTDARRLTTASVNGSFCSWSPDGTRIAYMRTIIPEQKNVEDSTLVPGAEKSTAVVYGRGPSNVTQFNPLHVCIVDATTAVSRIIASISAEVYENPTWATDGQTLYITCYFAYGDRQYNGRYSSVVCVDIATGKMKLLVDHCIADSMLCIPSPQGGGKLVFMGSPYHGGYFHDWQATYFDGKKSHRFNEPLRTNAIAWTSDGERLIAIRKVGVHDEILTEDLHGRCGVPFVKTQGQFTTNTIPAVSSDSRVAWFENDWQGRTLLKVGGEGRATRTVVNFNPEIDTYQLGTTETLSWKAPDGQQNAGILIKPIGYARGHRYPLLVDIHGGPLSGVHPMGVLLLGALEWQIWANKGYAVFIPEYRSSGIYGFGEFAKEHKSQRLFDGDFMDINSGIDSLIDRGIANPAKLICMGMSYGSIETNWLITHTNRFKAAISYEGEADFFATYGANGTPWYPIRWLLGGTPQQIPQAYIQNSAIYSAGRIMTPTLFLAGKNGANSPSLIRLYVALKERKIDTEYVVYGGEGHGVRRPANERDLVYRCIDWVDGHLK